MAETSGFFTAEWDESLVNPITQEQTGWWDRSYIAEQFAKYFALFIGNGVFGSPTNQLRVIPGVGLAVKVTEGFAFIKGYWYYNSEEKVLPLQANEGSLNRIDSIRVRLSDATKDIKVLAFTGDTDIVRGDTIYDLELAQVTVQPQATSISASVITDQRPNESVCGFVTQLLEVQTTEDLFAQYNTLFYTWFNATKATYTEWFSSHTNAFEEWFEDLTSELNVDTYIEEYEKSVLWTNNSDPFAARPYVVLDMDNYTYEQGDIFFVYANGLKLSKNEYQVYVENDVARVRYLQMSPVCTTTSFQELHVVVLKSKIGVVGI